MQRSTTLVLSLAATVTLTACQTGPAPTASTWQPNGLAYFDKADQDWNYQFIYHPDAQVYFEPYSETWFWFNDGQWHEGDALPYALPLERRDAVVVKTNSELPFMSHEQVVQAHPCNADLPTSIDPFAWTVQQNELAEAYVNVQEAAREAELRWHEEHRGNAVVTAEDDANWINEWSDSNVQNDGSTANANTPGRNWNLHEFSSNDGTTTEGNWDTNTTADASWAEGTNWSEESNNDWNTDATVNESSSTPTKGRNWNLHQLSADASSDENTEAYVDASESNWNSEASTTEATSTPVKGRNWNLHELSSNTPSDSNAPANATDTNWNTEATSNATSSNSNSNATAPTNAPASGRNWNLHQTGPNTTASNTNPTPVVKPNVIVAPAPKPLPTPVSSNTNTEFKPFTPTNDATASKSTVVPLPVDRSKKGEFVPFEKVVGADTEEDGVASGDPSAPFEEK